MLWKNSFWYRKSCDKQIPYCFRFQAGLANSGKSCLYSTDLVLFHFTEVGHQNFQTLRFKHRAGHD